MRKIICTILLMIYYEKINLSDVIKNIVILKNYIFGRLHLQKLMFAKMVPFNSITVPHLSCGTLQYDKNDRSWIDRQISLKMVAES